MNLRKLIKELRHKLRRDQDNLALRLELADLCRDDGNHDEAVQIYREVALGFFQAERLDEAKVACRRGLDLAPHDPELGALLTEIKGAQRASRDGDAGRGSLPQRRAQVWQTPSVAAPPVEPQPGDHPAGAAGVSERPSLLMDPPTPLPEPLALHDLPEDSLVAHQPRRMRSRVTSDVVPEIPLPSELEQRDDDVLALASAAATHRMHANLVEPAPRDDDGPDTVGLDSADDDDDEEDTDVRLQLGKVGPPSDDDGRASDDLTARVVRLIAEPARSATEDMIDDRPGAVSGEISLDDDDEPGDGRDTHPTLAGDQPAASGPEPVDDAGDEPTWIKELPDAPSPLPPGSRGARPGSRGGRPGSRGGRPGSRGAPPEAAPALPVVHDAGSAELLEQTRPVQLPRKARDAGPAMVAEAVDEEGILAEEAVEAQPRQRRRSAPRTIMDMAPPVPSAAASLGARKTALSAVFASFPEHVIEDLAEQVALRNFADAEHVLREGEPGRACFVVASGAVRILRRDPLSEGQELLEVARLSRGALFGERALLADRNRHGAVQAAGPCSLYEIPRQVLRELVVVHHALGPLLEVFYREHLIRTLIESVPFLRALPPTWRDSLGARFRPVRRASGETILRQGDRTGGLYLVVLGAVEITQRPSVRRARLLATLSEGMYFGDMSRHEERGVVGATVSAAGPVELAMLPADDFDAVVAERPALWAEICERGQRRELERSNLLTGETALL